MTETGGSSHPPDGVAWDGRDEAGSPLLEGAYTYTLVVTAGNGLATATPPQWVHIDRTPPSSSFNG